MNHEPGDNLTFNPVDTNLPQPVKFPLEVVSDRKDVGPIFYIITVRRCFCCNLYGLCDDPGRSQTDGPVRMTICEFLSLFSPLVDGGVPEMLSKSVCEVAASF